MGQRMSFQMVTAFCRVGTDLAVKILKAFRMVLSLLFQFKVLSLPSENKKKTNYYFDRTLFRKIECKLPLIFLISYLLLVFILIYFRLIKNTATHKLYLLNFFVNLSISIKNIQ